MLPVCATTLLICGNKIYFDIRLLIYRTFSYLYFHNIIQPLITQSRRTMKRKLLTLLSCIILIGQAPVADAAFVIRKNIAVETPAKTTSNAPAEAQETATTSTTTSSSTPDIGDRRPSKQEKKGYGLASFIVALVGAASLVGAALLLPTSVLGAVLLGILGMFLGILALGFGLIDKKSIAPRKGFATIGKVLGILESLPVLIVMGLSYFIYYLCGGKKKSSRRK